MDLQETHDVGRFYWHLNKRSRSWKPVQFSRAQMMEPPFRRGLGVFVSAPWLRSGVVVGFWGRIELRHDAEASSHLFNRNLPLGVRVVGESTEAVREWHV